MGLLGRLLVGPAGRSGAAPGPAVLATGIPPVLPGGVDGDILAAHQIVASVARPTAPPVAGRQAIDDAILSKVLHAWLQNRHQTLFPLALNVRTLDRRQRVTLARMAAVLLLAEHGHHRREADLAREGAARRWLVDAGAGVDTLEAMDEALLDPPAISRVIDAVLECGLASYAYVAALICLDLRNQSGLHLAEYLAARMALPTTLVRSANRRYGREATTAAQGSNG